MLKIRMLSTVVLLAIGFFPPSVMGQQTINGDLSGNLGPGTFIVDGNCNVPSGETLVIESGTTLLFSGAFYFSVYGQLNANGTETDSIKFIRQFPTEESRHRGIRFQSGSSVNSSLSYCWIDNGKNQNFPIYIGGALYVKDAGLTLSHCRITSSKSNTGGGLYAENSTIAITNCFFEADSAEMGAGIYADNCPITITESEFYDNVCLNNGYGGGIFLYASSQSIVSRCIIAGNSSAGS